MTVDQFLEKWETGWEQILYSDAGKREKMKADLEEMLFAAREDVYLKEAEERKGLFKSTRAKEGDCHCSDPSCCCMGFSKCHEETERVWGND